MCGQFAKLRLMRASDPHSSASVKPVAQYKCSLKSCAYVAPQGLDVVSRLKQETKQMSLGFVLIAANWEGKQSEPGVARADS